jgi:hypothetical protein
MPPGTDGTSASRSNSQRREFTARNFELESQPRKRSRKNRLIFGLLLAILLVLLVIVFSPVLLTRGVRLWVWWKSRGSNVTITFESVEAPFLRPIVLRGVRVQTKPEAEFRIDATAPRMVVALNLKGILLRTRGRALRNLQIEKLQVEIHRSKSGKPFSETGWNTVNRLLPESFELQSLDVRYEDAATLILLRGGSLSGSPIEAGRFHAGEMVVASPMFRQTFANLRGATDWQGDRLTVAGLTLSRGLDLQSITADLSHLGKRRVAVEFDVDAFGGKLRGSIADEWRSNRSNWNIAGSAGDISVSQTAEAFGFTDRVGGLIHAGKFIFRGDLGDALTGTASLWIELTSPTWRDREADVIMLGLSLYGSQLELQQLYIKQKKNQLTLNGESSFPTTAAAWLRPDFRGNVSASINDLGEFASLFGGDRNDFAGQIEVQGTLDARDRNVGGNLVANGSGLTMFKSSIDELHAEMKLKRAETEISQLELKRKNDHLWAQGKIDNSPEHNYSGVIDATVENITDYLSLFGGKLNAPPSTATLHADITSSVWEARTVLDPPRSKPIDLSGTFALRIGQSMDVFWNSPMTLSLDAPEVHLGELPRKNTSAGRFLDGTLSTKVTITESLRHPSVTGFAQFFDGRMGSNELNGRIRFEGNQGVIESVQIGGQQNSASFVGDIDLHDSQDLIVNLYPNQPLYDLATPMLDCVTGIELIPSTWAPAVPAVANIQLRGSITSPNWQLSLKESPLDGFVGLAPWSTSTRAFRFCLDQNGPQASLPLEIQLPEPVAPSRTPAHPKKRKR